MRPMPRLAALLLVALPLFAATSCDSTKHALPVSANSESIIGPVSIRIHPTFTQVKNWGGPTDKPDGSGARLGVGDGGGEPIRATGKVIFELYEYRKGHPDPRGER